MRIKHKIKKGINLLNSFFYKYKKSIKRFGISYSTEIFIGDIIIQLITHKIICNKKFESIFYNRRHCIIKKNIINNYGNIIFQELENHPQLTNNGPIWFCWLQGEEQMPEYVKLCYNSTKKNGTREVILITMDNYKKYIELPNHIIEKVNKGLFTYTFFTDILRANLLYKYGGLWCDSRILITQPLTKEYFNYNYFTVKNKTKNCWYVSDYRWTVGFMSASPHSPIFHLLMTFFSNYTKNEDFLIDYFLIDYTLSIAYEYNKQIKALIDAVPYNNESFFILVNNVTPNEQDYKKIQQTSLFLLPKYEKEELKKTLEDKSSLLNHILQLCY